MTAWKTDLILAADAAIDLQTHTHLSDGQWTPEQLLDHFVGEGFSLAAITDHDRPDTAAHLQALAAARNFPLLVAVEMTTTWRDELTDVLCFGFDPTPNALNTLAQDVLRRQCENTREVYANLHQKGYLPQHDVAELDAILQSPSAQQAHDLQVLVFRHNREKPDLSPGDIITEAGFFFAASDIASVVEAAHDSGAVALIAHPGRGGEFTRFDAPLLDELRREVPIDGLEAYYPRHTPEQIAAFQAYADQHHLLVSCGSDSHGPDRPPIKYRAELSRHLLNRLGVQVTP